MYKSILDNVVERNVTLDHGEQSLDAGIIRLTKGIENGVQGIALELKLFDIAFSGGSPSAVLCLVVYTFCASLQTI